MGTPAGFTFDKDAFDQWMGLFDLAVQLLNAPLHRISRNGIFKVNAQIGKDELRAHMQCQYLVNVLYFCMPASYTANALYHLRLRAFSHQKPFRFVGGPDGSTSQNQSDQNRCEPVITSVTG